MKRDMELIRKIAIAVESQPHGFVRDDLKIDGYSDEVIGYHAYLMLKAGLVTGADTTCRGSESPEASIRGLTWAGHEFVDASRNPKLWQRAMKTVGERVGSVGLDVLLAYLKKLAMDAVGLGEGSGDAAGDALVD